MNFHEWAKSQEAPGKTPPNITRMVKEVNGNVRAALMALELMLA